jgi:hypothetical protein
MGTNYRTRQKPLPVQAGSRVTNTAAKIIIIYIYIYTILLLIHFILFILTKHERENRALYKSAGCAQTICTYLQWSRTRFRRAVYIFCSLQPFNKITTMTLTIRITAVTGRQRQRQRRARWRTTRWTSDGRKPEQRKGLEMRPKTRQTTCLGPSSTFFFLYYYLN